MKFTVHALVKNEDQWVGYALKSVLSLAEQIFVYDTGSTDQTVSKIKALNCSKIICEERGLQTKKQLVDLRKEMLQKTKTEWFLILDGDEIWPKDQLQKLLKEAEIAPKNIIAIVNRNRNCIGDVYHYLPENAGKYALKGKVGNLTIRLFRKTPDLSITGEYPLEAYTNNKGEISKQDENLLLSDSWYLHTTYLKRSSSDQSKTSGSLGKVKIPEFGIKFKREELSQIFDEDLKAENIPQFKKREFFYDLLAFFLTPLIYLKRLLNV